MTKQRLAGIILDLRYLLFFPQEARFRFCSRRWLHLPVSKFQHHSQQLIRNQRLAAIRSFIYARVLFF